MINQARDKHLLGHRFEQKELDRLIIYFSSPIVKDKTIACEIIYAHADSQALREQALIVAEEICESMLKEPALINIETVSMIEIFPKGRLTGSAIFRTFILAAAQSRDSECRANSIPLLAMLATAQHEDAQKALSNALKDADDLVRKNALEAFRQIDKQFGA